MDVIFTIFDIFSEYSQHFVMLWKHREKDFLLKPICCVIASLNTFDLPGNVPCQSTFDWQKKIEQEYRKLTQQGYWMIEQETQSIYPNFLSQSMPS